MKLFLTQEFAFQVQHIKFTVSNSIFTVYDTNLIYPPDLRDNIYLPRINNDASENCNNMCSIVIFEENSIEYQENLT